jgi:hypothetical protein
MTGATLRIEPFRVSLFGGLFPKKKEIHLDGCVHLKLKDMRHRCEYAESCLMHDILLVQSCGHVYSSEERDARVEPTTLKPESRGTLRLDPRTILDCSRMHTTPRQASTIGYWSTSDTAVVVRAMLSMLGKAGVTGSLLTYSYLHLKRRLHRSDRITDSLHFSYFVSFVAL